MSSTVQAFCLGEVIMNKKLLVLSVFTVLGCGVPSASYATTIQESVSNAIASHPSVETALVGKVIAKENRKEAFSGYFPQISAGATAGRIYADNTTSRGLTVDRGAGYSWLGEGNIALTQPLFKGMETENRVDAAEARGQVADFTVANIKENLALQAAQSHIAAFQAQDKIAKIDMQIREMKSYQDRIQLLVDEGAADESEITQAQNIILALEEGRINEEGLLKSALARYHEVVGHYPKSKLQPVPSVNSMINPDPDVVISSLQAHPSIKAGAHEIEAVGHEVRVEQSGYYPTLDSELSYLKRDQRDIIGGESEDGRAVLRMGWEFETGGAQSARVRRARAQYSEAVSQNRETLNQIEGAVRRAYAEYETAEKQKTAIEKRRAVTQQLFTTYETQFEGAQVRLLQLMQGKSQLFNTDLELLDANYRSVIAQYAILASLGSLERNMSNIGRVQE